MINERQPKQASDDVSICGARRCSFRHRYDGEEEGSDQDIDRIASIVVEGRDDYRGRFMAEAAQQALKEDNVHISLEIVESR